MTITKKFASSAIAATMACTLAVPAMAFADTDVDASGNASTNMNIKVEATTINVNVPADVDPDNPPKDPDSEDYAAWLGATTLIFESTGEVKAANLPIQNNGTTAVTLQTVSATGKASTDSIFDNSTWTIHSWDNNVNYGNMKDKAEFGLKVGGKPMLGTDNNVSATLNKVINPGQKTTVAFESDENHRGSFSKTVLEKSAFNATFHFDLGNTPAE